MRDVSSEFLFSVQTNRQVVELQLSADGLLDSVADTVDFNFEIADDLHQVLREIGSSLFHMGWWVPGEESGQRGTPWMISRTRRPTTNW